MELKKLKCPECGANFESDEKVTVCSHCGSKLYFDDGNKNINYNYKAEDVAKIKQIEVNKELELNRRQQEKRKGIGLIVLVVIFIISFSSFFNGLKKESDMQEKELQSIVNEIYANIDEENYEIALIKANSLYYTAGWSSEIEEKWDDTRESLIKIIKKKMK